MGQMLMDDKSQKIANWICSDLKKNVPIYINLCDRVFKEKGIDLGIIIKRIMDNHIYLYVKDESEMLVCFVSTKDLGVSENNTWREKTPKELIDLWSQDGNFNIPTMFEGYLHTHLDVKDTLLDYDYIIAHIRDTKIDKVLT